LGEVRGRVRPQRVELELAGLSFLDRNEKLAGLAE